MNCRSCGAQNADNTFRCVQCGAVLQQAAPMGSPPNIPNYLVQAILVTIFCCLPFGIVSIVYAAQVGSKLGAGDYAGAQQASNNAKTWVWISFGLGLVATIISFMIGLLPILLQLQR